MKRWMLDFSLSSPGGANSYAVGFLEALGELGSPVDAHITVLLPSGSALAAQALKLEKSGLAVVRVDLGRAASWKARCNRQLRIPLISWQKRTDATFVPREAAPLLCRGKLVVLARNVKVWDRHHAVGLRNRTRWIVLHLNARLATRRAQRVLTVTATFGRSLPVPARKLSVVYHGCDLSAVAAGQRMERRGAILKIVCLGTLSTHKRFDLAIRTVAAMRRAGYAVELAIWGGPGTPGEAERLSRLGLDLLGSNPVRGVLAPVDRAATYADADILFVGSSYESFGQSMVEALRTSTLVLAPSSPLIDELCGTAAVTYVEGDAEDAARSLADALPHLDRLLAEGVERSAIFTWERCVVETLRQMSIVS